MEREIRDAPLAIRMRPQSLDEFEGQEKIIGPGRPLRRAIEMDRIVSAIFFGPPGTGKTALAGIIAKMTKSRFITLNAVMAGVADIRKVVEGARLALQKDGRKTVLFIDEIHRFNKAQQDALLPFVESGIITLIGSTTENPMVSVNRPLISRSRLYRFELLSEEAICRILTRAVTDRQRGLGEWNVEVERAALDYLAKASNGDARVALNALELAAMSVLPDKTGVRKVTLAAVEESLEKKVLPYDRVDEHYDVASAFIKSMRGSDPQATLYWLARMIYAGEDPAFIARRLMIHAAEDVGLADPRAFVVAASAALAVERVGMPEARIILAQAALYIAAAPKSNSVLKGIDAALKAVEEEVAEPVPVHLRGTGYAGARTLGHGAGYKYPHDYPGGYVRQEYLPPNMKGKVFYVPSGEGEEKEIKIRLARLLE